MRLELLRTGPGTRCQSWGVCERKKKEFETNYKSRKALKPDSGGDPVLEEKVVARPVDLRILF